MYRNSIITTIFIILFSLFLHAEKPTEESLIRLYVATFNRAPDAAGIEYWLFDSGLNLQEIAKSFFEQPETRNIYKDLSDKEQFIRQVYLNLFNREPDSAGLEYWKERLLSGAIEPSSFILALINGAMASSGGERDRDILKNKTEIGYYFYSLGLNDISLATKVMKYIDTDRESLIEAMDYIDRNSPQSLLVYRKGFQYSIKSDSQKALNFRDIIEREEGGYIFVGSTYDYFAHKNEDAIILETDKNGTVVNTFELKADGFDFSKKRFIQIDKISKNRYLILGEFEKNATTMADITIFTDNDNTLLSKLYTIKGSNLQNIDNWLRFTKVIPLSDGGFLVLGEQGGRDDNDSVSALVGRFDSAGKALFVKRYFAKKNGYFFTDALESEDGIYLTGYEKKSSSNSKIILSKIDGNGNFLWLKRYLRYLFADDGKKEYCDGYDTRGLGIEKIKDGLLLIAQDMTYRDRVDSLMGFKMDYDGEPFSVERYSSSCLSSYFKATKSDELGYIYISATDRSIMKIDQGGNFVYSAKIDTAWFDSFAVNRDGSVLLCGHNGDFSNKAIVLASNSNAKVFASTNSDIKSSFEKIDTNLISIKNISLNSEDLQIQDRDLSGSVKIAIDSSRYEHESSKNVDGDFYSEYSYKSMKLTKIIDGDTYRFDFDGENITCRVNGIDTPESIESSKLRRISEKCSIPKDIIKRAGVRAKHFVEQRLRVGEEYDVAIVDNDIYSRSVCKIIYDGDFIGKEIARYGYAVVMGHYLLSDKEKAEYSHLQENAQKRDYGLWLTDKKLMECIAYP